VLRGPVVNLLDNLVNKKGQMTAPSYICVSFLVLFLALAYHWHENQQQWFQSYRQARHQIGVAYGVWTRPSNGGIWWSRIGQRPLLLGPLPVYERLDGLELGFHDVTRVIALLEPFELEPGILFSPAINYSDNKIALVLPVVDGEPLEPVEKLHLWVQQLAERIDQGRTVYVHCRAGIGRSASLVIAYLMYSEGRSLYGAYGEVSLYRPQISPNQRQMEALVHYSDWLSERRQNLNK
jgi:protein-tyrosine phosphatase